MTTDNLRQPGIREQIEQLGYLLKHTLRYRSARYDAQRHAQLD